MIEIANLLYSDNPTILDNKPSIIEQTCFDFSKHLFWTKIWLEKYFSLANKILINKDDQNQWQNQLSKFDF